jgi:hypothetical protein
MLNEFYRGAHVLCYDVFSLDISGANAGTKLLSAVEAAVKLNKTGNCFQVSEARLRECRASPIIAEVVMLENIGERH